VEGDPDGAREILVPGVRDDHAAAGAVSCDATRFEKFGQHQPLNRQSERYRREGIDLNLSTLADQVGACTTVLQPLFALIAHRRAGRRWSKLAELLRPARPSHGELAWRVEPMVAEERTAPQKEGFRTLPSLPLPRRKLRLMPARLQVDA
jgi:Transposase IS66 family